jgi:hypothetical protein
MPSVVPGCCSGTPVMECADYKITAGSPPGRLRATKSAATMMNLREGRAPPILLEDSRGWAVVFPARFPPEQREVASRVV